MDSFVLPEVGIHVPCLFFLTALPKPIVPLFMILDLRSSCSLGRYLCDCRSKRVVSQLVQNPQEVPVLDGAVSFCVFGVFVLNHHGVLLFSPLPRSLADEDCKLAKF